MLLVLQKKEGARQTSVPERFKDHVEYKGDRANLVNYERRGSVKSREYLSVAHEKLNMH